MPSELISLLLDKGLLIALVFWLYLQERKERIAAQEQLENCLEGKHEKEPVKA